MIAETWLWELFGRQGWEMFEWQALGSQRYESRWPVMLWHCADAQAKFEQAAREYGLSLGNEHVGLGPWGE